MLIYNVVFCDSLWVKVLEWTREDVWYTIFIFCLFDDNGIGMWCIYGREFCMLFCLNK